MPKKGERTPGSGKPKGYKFSHTLDKEAARELVRKVVTAELGPMLEAQVAHAKGLRYLVVRDKHTGKFVRVTESMAKAKLGSQEELVEVWEKDPSVQAFTDLLNRAIDKPKEQLQELKILGDDEMLRRLHAGRARVAAAKKEKG
jgi:hypothetical protein